MTEGKDEDQRVLAVPADLAVAAAEDCRNALLTALAEDDGPVEITFEGDARVSTVALQLALAAAAAARSAGRQARFGAAARETMTQLGLES